jgi:hypothetical protein
MSSIPDLYYLVALATAGVSIAAGWASGRLFKTRTIKDIVETANATITLYELRETALEQKVDDLTTKVESLSAALTTSEAANKALRDFLIQLVGTNVTLPVGVTTSIPQQAPAA